MQRNCSSSRFDTIEDARTLQKAEQIVQAVEADLNQLAISARDYGHGIRCTTTSTIPIRTSSTSISPPYSLASMEVDMVAILNAQGELVFSAELLEDERQLRYPALAGAAKTLQSSA